MGHCVIGTLKEGVTMLEKFLEASKGLTSHGLSGITATTRLGDLPIDSLDLYTVIENLEEDSGKTLDDDAFEKMDTVEDLLTHFFFSQEP